MIETKIPIRNIFYLLAYAWDYSDLLNDLRVGEDTFTNIDEFYGILLSKCVSNLKQIGIYRNYKSTEATLRNPRGKFDLSASIKSASITKNMLVCSVDEYSIDNHENRIIKAAINLLMRSKNLRRNTSELLRTSMILFDEVDDIPLSAISFKSVNPPRQLRQYGFILSLCELIYDSALPDDSKPGLVKFRNFFKDQKTMPRIFEAFVRNFYKLEAKSFRSVSASKIEWDSNGSPLENLKYLPEMRTDITLEDEKQVLVIDTKFYQEALKENSFGTKKLISSNLYQILTYVSNWAKIDPSKQVLGMLLYPTVELSDPLDYTLQGYSIRIACIDLTKPWSEIHNRLVAIVSHFPTRCLYEKIG